MLVASALGAAAGCALLLVTPARAFAVVVPFLVLGASGLVAVQPRVKAWLGTRAGDRPRYLLAGATAGSVYGGYFGGGLGVILMALLGLTMAAPLRQVNVVKGALQLLVASVSLVVFAMFGPVQWVAAAVVAPLSLLGGSVGGRLAKRSSERVLRRCVVAFGLVVGTWLALRAFG